MPKNLKEKIKADIPPELVDKLPTEENVTDLKTLKEYLEKSQHPIMQRWTKEEAVAEAETPSEMAAPGWSMPSPSMPAGMPMQFGGGGTKLNFKNARISIERIVFKGKEK